MAVRSLTTVVATPIVVALAALLALVAWGLAANRAQVGLVAVPGQTARDFTLKLFDGGSFSLAGARGKPVVVNFWGSWCAPCREEAPVLNRAWENYGARVAFIGVDIWDNDRAARGYLAEVGARYPNGPDPSGEIAIDYGVSGVPETLFITRDGRVLHKFVGPLNDANLTRLLEQLLNS